MAHAKNKTVTPRTASKAERRTQLIEATIRCIAAHGLSDTTTALVSNEAGLSQGIISLHFDGKEGLLLATLERVVDEYRAVWEAALEDAPDEPAAQLAALSQVDFHPAICDRDKLAVWFAFWGESKARPTYRKLCAARDRGYDRMMVRLFREVARLGGYDNVEPDLAARGLTALTEGLWLDMLVSPRNVSRREAQRVSMAYLAQVFPQHFELEAERKAS